MREIRASKASNEKMVSYSTVLTRDAGAAVLLISDDLDEVLTLGDRVAVMHGGHMGQARAALDWSRESIGLAMAGAEDVAHAA